MALPTIKGHPYTEWFYQENLDEGTFTVGLNGDKITDKLSGNEMADAIRIVQIRFELCSNHDPETYSLMSYEEFFNTYLFHNNKTT